MQLVLQTDEVETDAGQGSKNSAAEVLRGLHQKLGSNPIKEKYEIQVELHDGRKVGSWSEDWRLECEAKYLLKMPLAQRREALARREEGRGWQRVEFLKARMTAIHKAGGVAKPATRN